MFRFFRRSSLSLTFLSKRSLCADASKQAKIEELIKRSQQLENMSTTQKFMSWLSKNRQQLMNTVMVFFIFQYSFHIYNVQTIYNDTVAKLKEKEDEIINIKEVLTNNDWIKSTEDKIIKSKKNGILLNEINTRIKSLEPETPLDLVTKYQKNDDANNEKKGSMI